MSCGDARRAKVLEVSSPKYLLNYDVPNAVSHHPPISAFYYVSPANKVAVIGELRPKSRFLGNSVSTFMEGENRVYLLGRPEDNGACSVSCRIARTSLCVVTFVLIWTGSVDYVISMPNMYARGILWGKMFLELGDSCTAKNEATGHYAEIQFKTKVAVDDLISHLSLLKHTDPCLCGCIGNRDTSRGRTTPSRGAYGAGTATSAK